jgi:hypothetical protein
MLKTTQHNTLVNIEKHQSSCKDTTTACYHLVRS